MSRPFALLLLFPALLPAAQTAPGIALIGVGTLPGDSADLSGLKGKQNDGTPHNRLGGLGSAIAYTGKGTGYLLASDRGPKDGATDFACRVHAMDIAIRPGDAVPVKLTLTGTTLLTDDGGNRPVGTAAELTRRLDPEGVRVGRGGHFYLSDEYGPTVAEYDPAGRRVKSFAIPDRFTPTRAAAKVEDELPPKNSRGRQPNRGFEGLAVSPDGKKLFAALQSPLIQDGALDAEAKRMGLNVRILEIDRDTGKTREFVYRLHDAGNGVNEILAINAHQFLVLERDGKAGTEAKFKRIYLIDLTGATDVSRVPALPATALPAGVAAVRTAPFLDLLDPRFGLAGPDFPEKIEGLAFGPDLPDGRRLLVVTADNDFVAEVPFRVLAFGIDRRLLPGFVSQAGE